MHDEGDAGCARGAAAASGVGDLSGSATKFGANAGAGFDLKLGSAALYAEGRFHAILKGGVDAETGEEATASMVPLTVGLRWSLR